MGRVERCAAVVLAGGKSTRMRRSKGSLEWRGRPLVVHVAEVLAAAVDGPIVVVRAPGQDLPPLPADVRLVEDARPGRGPLEGIAAGLRALSAEVGVVFVSAVDAPFLAPAFVAHMIAGLEEGVDAAVPVRDGRPHPLAAAYRVGRTLETVERRLAGDDLSVRGLLDDLGVRFLDEADLLTDAELRAADPALDSLVNLNTPQDYADAVARGG
jgi:molybdopterin-guanine dinucleotide biosynthesis protein A